MAQVLADEIKQKIATAVGINVEKIGLEHPKSEEFGDYSTNIAMVLKGGVNLADEIAEKLKSDPMFEKVEVAGGGFLNIWLQFDYLVNYIDRVLNDGVKGVIPIAFTDKTVIIDYSSPNIAKYFGIGHLRSTIIGQTLYNLWKLLGAKVIGDNHLGDWGTQFGKLITMIKRHDQEELSLDNLEKWYVEFHTLSKDDQNLEVEARNWFKKLEEGDSEAKMIWKKCVEVSMHEFERVYKVLGVNIDEHYGESFYEKAMNEVISKAKSSGIARESEGAWVIDVESSKTPLMLLKSDGGTTYATRDLATLKFRQEKWHPDLIIYEVGGEQNEYFKQVFEAGRKLGLVDPTTELVHTKHGMYLDENGKKFKTRTGNTVKLEEVLNEAIERAKKLGNENGEVAQAVGVGAIKYFDLMHSVQSDIVFDWVKIISLEGNSGPYLQYTYARINSVLNKSENRVVEMVRNYNPNAEELAILRWAYRFSEVVFDAARQFAPNLLCLYLFELGQKFNVFYNKHSILTPDNDDQKKFRLRLTSGVGEILKAGLKLLGIEALERM